MISRFGLKNYKSWKDEKHFELGKISLIFGQNSAGKSSVIQALSLLNASTNEFQLAPIANPLQFKSESERPRASNIKTPFPKLNIHSNKQKFGNLDNILHQSKSRAPNPLQEFYFSINREDLLNSYLSELQSKKYFFQDNGYGEFIGASEKELLEFRNSLNERIPTSVEKINFELIFDNAILSSFRIYFDEKLITVLHVDQEGHIIQTEINDEDKNLWGSLLGLNKPNDELRSIPLEFISSMERNTKYYGRSEKQISLNDAISVLQAIIYKFSKANWEPGANFRDHPKINNDGFKKEIDKLRNRIKHGQIISSEILNFIKDFINLLLKVEKTLYSPENDLKYSFSNSLKAFSDRSARWNNNLYNETQKLFSEMEKDAFHLNRLVNDKKLQSLRQAYFRKQLLQFRERLELNNPDDIDIMYINARILKDAYHDMLAGKLKNSEKNEPQHSEDLFLLSSAPSNEFVSFKNWREEALRVVLNHDPFEEFSTELEIQEVVLEQKSMLLQFLERWENFIDHMLRIELIVAETNSHFERIKSISLEDFLAKFTPNDFDDKIKPNFCKPTRSLGFLDELKNYMENVGTGQINFSSDFHFYYDLYHQFEERGNFSKYLNFFSILEFSIKYLSDSLKNMEFIGANRETPDRYVIEDLQSGDTLYKEFFSGKVSELQLKLINQSLYALDVPYELCMPDNDNLRTVVKQMLFKDSMGNKIPLQDLGYGISQIVPIVIACFTRQNKTIIIEQPEAQVHPRLQANFADIFALSAHFNQNRFILETHSEHLFLRFQRRFRELDEYKMLLQGHYGEDEIMSYGEEQGESSKRAKSQTTIPLKDELEERSNRLQDLRLETLGDKNFFNDLYSLISHEKIKVHAVDIDRKTGVSLVSEIKLTSSGKFTGTWPGGFFGERFHELGL